MRALTGLQGVGSLWGQCGVSVGLEPPPPPPPPSPPRVLTKSHNPLHFITQCKALYPPGERILTRPKLDHTDGHEPIGRSLSVIMNKGWVWGKKGKGLDLNLTTNQTRSKAATDHD